MLTLEQALTAVGQGWHPLVRRAYELAGAGGARVAHVTEDCGALRVYSDAAPRSLLAEQLMWIERQSPSRCEVCGAPGERRADARGWLSTRCEVHR